MLRFISFDWQAWLNRKAAVQITVSRIIDVKRRALRSRLVLWPRPTSVLKAICNIYEYELRKICTGNFFRLSDSYDLKDTFRTILLVTW